MFSSTEMLQASRGKIPAKIGAEKTPLCSMFLPRNGLPRMWLSGMAGSLA